MSRIAYLLLAFHSNLWLFGALFYWMIWAFLAVVLLGSLFSIYLACRPGVLIHQEESFEELEEDNNPFNDNSAPPPVH